MLSKEEQKRYDAFHSKFVEMHYVIEGLQADVREFMDDMKTFVNMVNDRENSLYELGKEFPALTLGTDGQKSDVRPILEDIGNFIFGMYAFADGMGAFFQGVESFAGVVLREREVLVAEGTDAESRERILVDFEEGVVAFRVAVDVQVLVLKRQIAIHDALKARHKGLMN